MPIQIRPKDAICQRAAGEMLGPALRRMVAADAAATDPAQRVMKRSSPDLRAGLSAVAAHRAGRTAVDLATGEVLAWLIVGGVTRTAAARALGIRAETLARLLGPWEHVASARGCDLIRAEDGSWTVARVEVAG